MTPCLSSVAASSRRLARWPCIAPKGNHLTTIACLSKKKSRLKFQRPRATQRRPSKSVRKAITVKILPLPGTRMRAIVHVQYLCNKCYHILISHFVEEGVELKGEENSSSTSGLPRARVRNVSLPRLNASTYGGNQIHDRDRPKNPTNN